MSLDDLETEPAQGGVLLGGVGHQAQATSPEIGENLRTGAVVAGIGFKPEVEVRLHGVFPFVLEFVGAQLVEQADAAARSGADDAPDAPGQRPTGEIRQHGEDAVHALGGAEPEYWTVDTDPAGGSGFTAAVLFELPSAELVAVADLKAELAAKRQRRESFENEHRRLAEGTAELAGREGQQEEAGDRRTRLRPREAQRAVDEVRRAAELAGAADFIERPFIDRVLLRRVQSALETSDAA